MAPETPTPPSPRPAPTRAADRVGERGSAYIVALLVLMVLSIVGLSLVLITGIEDQIGSTERTLNRTFYSADSGIAVAVARLVNSRASDPFRFDMNQDTTGLVRRGDEVVLSGIHPTQLFYCNLCTANTGSPFFNVQHMVVAESTRFAELADGRRRPLAQQEVYVTIQVEPSQQPDLGPGIAAASRRQTALRIEDSVLPEDFQ